jgi:HSP20 family molecular chaperone IbpA
MPEPRTKVPTARRDDAIKEDKGYLRQELRYGSLTRTLPLPEGVTGSDVKATYKAGILEIRIPEPKQAPSAAIGRRHQERMGTPRWAREVTGWPTWRC